MKQSQRKSTPDENMRDLNQVMISGQIASEVRIQSETRYVFTLRNKYGWFYVLWQYPDWVPRKKQRVLVRGSIFSVIGKKGNITRIQADEVVLLGTGNLGSSRLAN